MPLKAATYDGDTPDSLRVAARNTGRVIISNPDMLHRDTAQSSQMDTVFLQPQVYSIDRAHTCRGVLGSHVANLIRRLRRSRFLRIGPPVHSLFRHHCQSQ
ncbi:MAG: hypothetical protein LBD55_03970 [Treponema sp.]|nr:hypothetical protein [Treponema sp.]